MLNAFDEHFLHQFIVFSAEAYRCTCNAHMCTRLKTVLINRIVMPCTCAMCIVICTWAKQLGIAFNLILKWHSFSFEISELSVFGMEYLKRKSYSAWLHGCWQYNDQKFWIRTDSNWIIKFNWHFMPNEFQYWFPHTQTDWFENGFE